MYNHSTPLHKGQSEGTKKQAIRTQEKRVFDAMHRRPVTMLMAAHETGVERANICRIVAALKRSGLIWLLYRMPCEISKDVAGYYTTDQQKAQRIHEHLNTMKP